MDDNKIIKLFNERKENAIIELNKKYRNYCFTISYNILKNKEDAEECLNDTYLKVWETIPPSSPKSLLKYIGKIARNISIDKYRNNSSKKRGGGEVKLVLDELQDLILDNGDIVEEIVYKDVVMEINKYLASIKKEKRIIFVMRYYFAYDIKTIAKKLKISESNVKMSLLRMRRNIKEHLNKEGIVL